MVSPYLGNTYKLRGGGRRWSLCITGVSRGALLGQARAPPQPLVSLTNFASPANFAPSADFTAVASVSLQRKPYQVYSYLGAHATPVVKSSEIKNSYCDLTSVRSLPPMCCLRIAVYVTCLIRCILQPRSASSQEPLENETQGTCDKILSITTVALEELTSTHNTR